MDSFLPPFFAIAASLALIAALTFLWRSLRAAFGVADSFHLPSAEAESRRILEERKTALLSNLADLEFEHAGDKISDVDYEALDKKLRAEAKSVLRLLDDDVKPYRAKAEQRLKGYLSERGAPYREQAEKPVAQEQELKSEVLDAREERVKIGQKEDESSKALLDDALESDAAEKNVVENACLKCDTVNDADAAFCKKCGTAMSDEAEQTEASESASDAEEDAR
ncbi:MAG: ribosomal protein L40E [Polyangiales bacterium]|jgi:ribosomal protein L40E